MDNTVFGEPFQTTQPPFGQAVTPSSVCTPAGAAARAGPAGWVAPLQDAAGEMETTQPSSGPGGGGRERERKEGQNNLRQQHPGDGVSSATRWDPPTVSASADTKGGSGLRKEGPQEEGCPPPSPRVPRRPLSRTRSLHGSRALWAQQLGSGR